jgi:bifunctional NMN adenylyltransferase/nudix hydrolase
MNQKSHTADAAVYIGRFQPFHAGHADLLRQALEIAPIAVVVIGSAHQARTPKNPFSWEERAEMIRLAVPEAQRDRLVFVPVRDFYDQDRWIAAVRAEVAKSLAERSKGEASIALVGHFKDATSEYLRGFSGWQLASVERQSAADATALRDAYFGSGGEHLDSTLAALVDQAPASTLEFLRAWAELPDFASLVEESQAPYPPVFVTVDAVVRCAGHILLVRRGQAPGKGLRAVPGGFVEQRETLYQSAVRELREETGFGLLEMSLRQALKAVVVFDHPDRSQRGRTITHAHFFDLGDIELPEVHAGDDAAEVEWVATADLSSLEDCFLDDHFHMLDHFLGLT